MTDERWQEDPFKKLDEVGADPDHPYHRLAKEVVESKIAEAGRRDAEHELQRTVTNIHALACNLLNVETGARQRVFVGVSPHSATTWTACVRYESFSFLTTRSTIGEALDAVLKDLVDRVSHRIEDDAKLLAEVKP